MEITMLLHQDPFVNSKLTVFWEMHLVFYSF